MICIPEFTNLFCSKKFQDDISLFQEYCFEKVKRFFIHPLNYVKFFQSQEIKSTLAYIFNFDIFNLTNVIAKWDHIIEI